MTPRVGTLSPLTGRETEAQKGLVDLACKSLTAHEVPGLILSRVPTASPMRTLRAVPSLKDNGLLW